MIQYDPYEGISRIQHLVGSQYSDPEILLRQIITVAKCFLPKEKCDYPSSCEHEWFHDAEGRVIGCSCHKKPEMPCTCIEDMGPMSCPKHTPVVSDEREWRKALLESLSSELWGWFYAGEFSDLKGYERMKKSLEDLRRKFT